MFNTLAILEFDTADKRKSMSNMVAILESNVADTGSSK